jgi:hypothetical protein
VVLAFLLLTPFLHEFIAEGELLLMRGSRIVQLQKLTLEDCTNVSDEWGNFFWCRFQLVDSCLLYFEEVPVEPALGE